MQLPTVKLQANDGKHEDSKKEQQANLEERHHGLHDGFQHNLQAWEEKERAQLSTVMQVPYLGHVHPTTDKRRTVSREDGQSSDRCKRPAQPGGSLWAAEDHGGKHHPRGSREDQAAEQGSRRAGFWIWSPLWCPACPCPIRTWWDMTHAALSPSLPPGHGSSTPPSWCPGQEGQEDWSQQQPSFFIYPHAGR